MGTTDNSFRLKLQQSLKEIEKLMRQKQYNIAMIKTRQTLEYMVNFLGEKALIIEGDLADSIDQLYHRRLISQTTKGHYHRIRMIGNKAVHEGDDSPFDAKEACNLLAEEVNTFANSFHNKKYRPSPVKTEPITSKNTAKRISSRGKYQTKPGRSEKNRQRPLRKQTSSNGHRSYSKKRSRRRSRNNELQLSELLKPLLIFLVILIIAVIIVKSIPGKDDKKSTTPVQTAPEVTTTETLPSTQPATETLPPETQAEAPTQKSYVTTSNLNVRSTPSTTGTLLGTLASGTVVDFVKTHDDKWTVIKFGGEEAYVATEFLKQSEVTTPAQ